MNMNAIEQAREIARRKYQNSQEKTNNFDQAEIENLINCPKRVLVPPKKQDRQEGAFWRNDMKLCESDSKLEFLVFMRKSDDFPENFSIGLRYQPNDGRPEITLLRCNGQHGIYNGSKSFTSDHPHFDYHIHRGSSIALDEGFKAEKYAEITNRYACYDEALIYFLEAINLHPDDTTRYFPKRLQSTMFERGDDGTT